MIKNKASNLFSVCESRSNPYFNAVEIVNNKIKPLKKSKKKYTLDSPLPKFSILMPLYIFGKEII